MRFADLPPPHAAFLDRALTVLQTDARIVGVAVGGSFLSRQMDAYSDLDFVVAAEPAAFEALSAERHRIAAALGPLVAAFTGEHVGEPRLLICLYDDPPLHVDLKFVALPDVAVRVEDPAVLWERNGRLTQALHTREAQYPAPDLAWLEARFWTWVHFTAAKVGRGELFEALDALAFLRGKVLAPLALLEAGARPQSLRRIEVLAPHRAAEMKATVCGHDAVACAAALRATSDLYRSLRSALAPAGFAPNTDAERVAMTYLAQITAQVSDAG